MKSLITSTIAWLHSRVSKNSFTYSNFDSNEVQCTLQLEEKIQ
jgi:hypothetical protein